MENILLITLLVSQVINLTVICLFWRKNNALNADMALALKNILEFHDKQFSTNFDSLKKMQEWNEKAFEINNDNFIKIATAEDQTQRFLGRMAEGLGLQTRSNLQDL